MSLSLGVAIKLGKRPAEVAQWPLEELAQVAAYCELEAESFKQGSSATSGGSPGGRTTTTRKVTFRNSKEK